MFISVKDITKSYGSKEVKNQVLNGVTTEIEKGEICIILGPSGSGKSTLLNIIGGLDQADKGSITIGDEEITSYDLKKLALYRRNKLGFIFQFYNLIPNLTVKENIRVCMELAKDPIDMDEILEILDMKDFADKYPSQLSGGQQQRCAIARAIVKNPEILLCDEPTGALDYKNSKEILKLMEFINEKYHTTILMVTHNEALRAMGDKIITIKDGKIEEQAHNQKREKVENIEW